MAVVEAGALRHRVAEEVRAYRARRRMTQVEIARLLGLSQASVSARMSGAQPFTLDEIEILSQAFDCSPEDLIKSRWTSPTRALLLNLTSRILPIRTVRPSFSIG